MNVVTPLKNGAKLTMAVKGHSRLDHTVTSARHMWMLPRVSIHAICESAQHHQGRLNPIVSVHICLSELCSSVNRAMLLPSS